MGKAFKQESMNKGLLLSMCGAIFGWTLGQIGRQGRFINLDSCIVIDHYCSKTDEKTLQDIITIANI